MPRYITDADTMRVLSEYYHHRTDVQMNALTEAISRVPTADVIEAPRWIPVTERLPLLNTPVLATDGIEVDISWMYGVPPRWITSYTAINEDKLTHWMPLPQTPKEE